MEEFDLISEIQDRQKELMQAFVDGLPDWESYLRILNQYRGLEESKSIIHAAYIRQNNGDGTDADTELE